MNITLTQQQSFELAQRFAEDIHQQMVEMHLSVTNHLFPDSILDLPKRGGAFLEAQAAIRSVTGPERADFIRSIRWCLDDLCKKRGTERRWQVALAKVIEAQTQNRAIAA